MSAPFLGEIRIVGFNFAPRGWALCDGQLLPISQNAALFALLGTFYGGNGTSNFALPNLQGSAPIGVGQGPGLTDRAIGEVGGETAVTLALSQLPVHAHLLTVSTVNADRSNATGNLFAMPQDATYNASAPDGAANPGSTSVVGGGQPHNNLSPYLVLNFVIALQGIFPSRN